MDAEEREAHIKMVGQLTADLGWEDTTVRFTVNGVTEMESMDGRGVISFILLALRLREYEDEALSS